MTWEGIDIELLISVRVFIHPKFSIYEKQCNPVWVYIQGNIKMFWERNLTNKLIQQVVCHIGFSFSSQQVGYTHFYAAMGKISQKQCNKKLKSNEALYFYFHLIKT